MFDREKNCSQPTSKIEGKKAANQTGLNTSTHLVMSLVEERRSERQTFELEAKRVRNRRQVRCKVLL